MLCGFRPIDGEHSFEFKVVYTRVYFQTFRFRLASSMSIEMISQCLRSFPIQTELEWGGMDEWVKASKLQSGTGKE